MVATDRCQTCQAIRPAGALQGLCPHCLMGLGLTEASEESEAGGFSEGQATAGGLRLAKEIARGGMGLIFRAFDPNFERDVAVKVLQNRYRDDPVIVGRFENEARIAGKLQHPGIVPVFAIGRLDDGRPFYAMKLVHGRTLAEILATRGDHREGNDSLLSHFEKIAQAVGYAHSRGVLHRDIKPSNVMVGEFGEVQVMDWGIAELLSVGSEHDRVAESPRAPRAVGTPGYMAPELFAKNPVPPDTRTDVFALGSILCEILTGEPAYYADSSNATLKKAKDAELADAATRLASSAADSELIALAKECLALDPSRRPRNAGEVAARVDRYLQSVAQRLRQAELAETEAKTRAAEERKRRRLWAVLACMVVSLAGVVTVGFLTWERRERERESAAALLLRDLTRMRDAAAEDPSGDPARWAAASEAVTRALPLLADASIGARGRLTDLGHDIERRWKQADDDRALLDGLELARFRTYDQEFRAALDLYKTSLRQADLDDQGGTPSEIGRAVASRPPRVRDAIVAGLDGWAIFARNLKSPIAGGEPPWRLALESAREADPDPTRNAMRKAFQNGDFATIVELTKSVDPERVSPASLCLMGRMLMAGGQVSAAIDLLRKARRAHPDDFWINLDLSLPLSFRPDTADEALIYVTAAVSLRPKSAAAHLRRAAILDLRLDHVDAEAEYREAIRLWPDYGPAHGRLAMMLTFSLGRDAEAVEEFRRAMVLQPDRASSARGLLIHCLTRLRRYEEAIAELELAAKAAPGDAAPLLQIAHIRTCQRDAVKAAEALDRAAKRIKPGSPDEAQLVQEKAFRDRLERLTHDLKAERKFKDNAERLDLAQFCGEVGLNASAARLYAEACTIDPSFRPGERGARLAARAASIHPDEAEPIDEATRTKFRTQAFLWLHQELDGLAKTLDDPRAVERKFLISNVRRWLTTPDFAGVREPQALSAIPKAEREPWITFWRNLSATVQDTSK